jgi:hypothetical protein
MGSGTVLRENTHKRRENPYFVDFLKFFGPERPMKARSIPEGTVGGYFLVIACNRAGHVQVASTR